MFFLIRHASHDQLGRTLSGWTPGVHLNAAGRLEADWLAGQLAESQVEAVYTSPLECCVETAEAIAAAVPCALRVRDELGEIRFGEWTGRSFAELESDPLWLQFNAHRSRVRIPGGETMADVQRRVVRQLENLQARHGFGPVVVVSHGEVLGAAIAYFLGLSLDALARFELAPASISVAAFEPDGPRLHGLNQTPPRRALARTHDAAVTPARAEHLALSGSR